MVKMFGRFFRYHYADKISCCISICQPDITIICQKLHCFLIGAFFAAVLLFFYFSFLKTKNMYYNKSCGHGGYAMNPNAAKGEAYGRQRPMMIRGMQRAAVNIYKTDDSFEMLVFAPGRIKEHFKIDMEGRELRISYTPPEGFPKFNWVQREYSRGGFVRSFVLDETIDAAGITARYEDGVLQVHLPLVTGKEAVKKEIVVE
jgi:HSP20 family protein